MTRTYLGVGLVTLATLLLELLLTRIFSVTLYYHFAFMVISLALFGIGVSGVVLYLKPERFPEEKLAELLSQYSRRFAVAIVLSLIYVVNHGVSDHLDATGVSRFSWQSAFQLTFLYLFAALPFYFGGMTVSLALYHLRRRVATLYFYDLCGASLACLVLDPLLGALGGPAGRSARGAVESVQTPIDLPGARGAGEPSPRPDGARVGEDLDDLRFAPYNHPSKDLRERSSAHGAATTPRRSGVQIAPGV